MSETTALTTTDGTAKAVSRSTTSVRAVTPAATVRTVEAILRPPGARDIIPDGPLAGYSRTMVEAVKRSVAKGAPDEELYRFFVQAIRYNLDPMAREIWCINTAGDGKQPQWQVTPSRDGLRRVARRNPLVADVRSGLVRDGDEFTMNGDGDYDYRTRITAKKGAILGAYCQIIMADGRKHCEFFYLEEVRRQTSVWQQFPDRMVVAAAERTMIKRHVGLSDLFIDDAAFERINEMDAALLVDPTPQPEYFEGFPIVDAPAGELSAGAAGGEQATFANGRGDRATAVAALNARIAQIAETVKDAKGGDAQDARSAWLKAIGQKPLSRIDDKDAVWDLVDLLESEDGADHFTQLLTEAREARWQKEAKAKEYADAGMAPPADPAPSPAAAIDTTAEVVDADDDIPPFDGQPVIEGEVLP